MFLIIRCVLTLTAYSLYSPKWLTCKACPPIDPEIVGAEGKFKRSEPQSFTVNVKYCEGQDELYYKWELYGHKGPNSLTYTDLFDTKPVYKFDGYRLVYPKDLVYDVEFQLKVKLSHFEDFSYPVETEKRFVLIPDEMHLEIKGGSSRTHSLSDLTLDGTGSKDLSFSPTEDHFANSKITWTSNPKLPPGVNIPKTLIWVVPEKFLKIGDVYDFGLTVRRTVFPDYPDTKTVRQRVTIVDLANAPNLKLQCIRNCLDPNPEESTLIWASCVNNCGVNINYEWEIEPGTDNIEFGNGYDLLLVEANVFQPGQSVKFIVKSGEIASASLDLKYMDGIIVGTCDIEPKSGISGVTNFKIICEGFKSAKNGALRYNVYLKTKGDSKTLLISSPKSELRNIILTEGNPAVLTILIRDSYFMSVEITLNVQVTPFVEEISKENLYRALQRLVLIKLVNPKILKSRGTSLGKNFDAVIQFSSFIIDEMERNPAKDDNEKLKQNDILKHVIESIYNLDVATVPSVNQVLSVIGKYYSLKKLIGIIGIEPYVSQMISKCLLKASKVLYEAVSDPREIFITTTFIENVAKDILTYSSNVIQEIFHDFQVLFIADSYEYYESYEEVSSDVFLLELSRRRILEDMIESVEELCKSLVFVHVADQQPVEVRNEYIDLMTLRLDPKVNLAEKIIQEGDKSRVQVTKQLAEDFKAFVIVDFQIVVLNLRKFNFFKNNPVREKLSTETVVVNMYGNRTRKLFNFNSKFILHLKRTSESLSEFIQGDIKSDFVVHMVKMEIGQMLRIIFDLPESELKIVMKSCYPNFKDFEKPDMIIKQDSNDKIFNYYPEKNQDGYLGILADKPTSYKASLETFSCAYYNASLNAWRKDYCKPIEVTTKFIICECSHTSLFGGEYFVAPNRIQITSHANFILSTLQNPLTIITVSTILVIWILLLIWAKRKDDKLKKRNLAIPFKDNFPGDEYAYALIIFTGIQYDGNTSSDVALQLIGNLSVSRIHVIRTPNEDHLLCRGNDDCFLLFTPENLGEIIKIRLWHNCKGWKPHWYCDKIIVRDLQDDKIYEFEIKSWFSLIWGDGKIYREFLVNKGDSRNVKREVFMGIRDKHLWLSIWARPSQSSFSSKERVTAVISSLLLSMLVSAMFYGVATRNEGSMDPQGSFYVTWREFLIVIQTMVITIPVNMGVTFMFRNSKPKDG